ncbi:MAG: hypothetical protein HY898_02120 [Deltaproteobacteria bacterium]|nr:hypothetical protein [Deltaproteobacteria bacterium]
MDTPRIAYAPVRPPRRVRRSTEDLDDSWFSWRVVQPPVQEAAAEVPELGDPLADEWFRRGRI